MRTAIVVGPGGIGKGPLDDLFKVDTKIDPHRLRNAGHPRNADDKFYAHPKLRKELSLLLETFGNTERRFGPPELEIKWFGKSKTLLYKVRKDYQFLVLLGLESCNSAKAEIYAPLLPYILSDQDVKKFFGTVDIIVLNPCPVSISQMQNLDDLKDLKERTRENCTKRGDSDEDVEKRVASIAEEVEAWRQLIDEYGATEVTGWGFAEYLYTERPKGILERQKELLRKARECLLKSNPDLEVFFKSEDDIDSISEPFVKLESRVDQGLPPAFLVRKEDSKEDLGNRRRIDGRNDRKLLVTKIYDKAEKPADKVVWEPPEERPKCPVQEMDDTEIAVFNQYAEQDCHYHILGTEVYMVLEGVVEIEVDSETYLLSAGDMIVVNPGTKHEVKPNENKPFLCRVVTVNCHGKKDRYPCA